MPPLPRPAAVASPSRASSWRTRRASIPIRTPTNTGTEPRRGLPRRPGPRHAHRRRHRPEHRHLGQPRKPGESDPDDLGRMRAVGRPCGQPTRPAATASPQVLQRGSTYPQRRDPHGQANPESDRADGLRRHDAHRDAVTRSREPVSEQQGPNRRRQWPSHLLLHQRLHHRRVGCELCHVGCSPTRPTWTTTSRSTLRSASSWRRTCGGSRPTWTGTDRGVRDCWLESPTGTCTSSDIKLDFGQIDTGTGDVWEDRRKTAVHEVGHSVGLGHDTISAMKNGRDPGQLADLAHVQRARHHLPHQRRVLGDTTHA